MIAVLWLMLIFSPEPIHPVEPIVGKWRGQWESSDGIQRYVGKFEFAIGWNRDRLEGYLKPLTGEIHGFLLDTSRIDKESVKIEKQHGTLLIRNIVETSNDATYQWRIDGACWAISIEGDNMSGTIERGGTCSAGVRLFSTVKGTRLSKRK
jgi:hypothetical protein